MLGPIIFNFYVNYLFFFIKQATVYKYADNDTLAYFSKVLKKVLGNQGSKDILSNLKKL